MVLRSALITFGMQTLTRSDVSNEWFRGTASGIINSEPVIYDDLLDTHGLAQSGWTSDTGTTTAARMNQSEFAAAFDARYPDPTRGQAVSMRYYAGQDQELPTPPAPDNFLLSVDLLATVRTSRVGDGGSHAVTGTPSVKLWWQLADVGTVLSNSDSPLIPTDEWVTLDLPGSRFTLTELQSAIAQGSRMTLDFGGGEDSIGSGYNAPTVDEVAWLAVRISWEEPAGLPPLRQFPRDDHLATASARRLWPSSSQQATNRRLGYY